MEIEKLNEWNPWWENKDFINRLIGISRTKYEHLVNSISIREIIVITGIRRCGKSTLMYQMINKLLLEGTDPKQILFINFDDNKLNENSLDEIYLSYRE